LSTEPSVSFSYATLDNWDSTDHAPAHLSTLAADIALGLIRWLVPDRARPHTLRPRAVAMRFVIEREAMGMPSFDAAARLAGVSRSQFAAYVLDFENQFQIKTRPGKRL